MIHCFTINNRKLVLDIASGAVHAMDDTAYQIVELLNRYVEKEPGLPVSGFLAASCFMADVHNTLCECDHDEINETLSEIQSLIEAGQLFTHDDVEKEQSLMREREPVVKALCLHIAHACNLSCAYCFAGQGSYGGDLGLMSLETGKKAIDFLLTHSGKRRNLEVDFFGGEPTLNFEMVKGIVAYGRQKAAETGKKFRFTLTTNGTRLDDETNRYINEHMDNVVLSIDGRPEVHDRMRKNTDGTGGYGDIIQKLLTLAESRHHERYYVRGTYTRYNMDFSKDVLHLADQGFTQISVEPVVAPASADYAIRPEDVPFLCREYEDLAANLYAREQDGKAVRFFHFEVDLEGGPCIAKKITGCGAGTEYLAVTPGGSLYPCHQFVGETAFCIGHLDTGVTRADVCKRFGSLSVYDKPECAHCWARYYCSGGCAANAYHQRGDISQPDETGCRLQRKRIECALYLYAERRLSS